MNKYLIIMSCGIFNICFGILHLFFWKMFDWKNDLPKISYYNRATLQILNLRMIYVFLSVGVILILFNESILNTKLGNAILVGIFLFWVGRLIEQFIFLKEKSKKSIALAFVLIFGVLLHLASII